VIKLKKDATFLEFIRLNIKGGKILAYLVKSTSLREKADYILGFIE
jgi:hypothetical protein